MTFPSRPEASWVISISEPQGMALATLQQNALTKEAAPAEIVLLGTSILLCPIICQTNFILFYIKVWCLLLVYYECCKLHSVAKLHLLAKSFFSICLFCNLWLELHSEKSLRRYFFRLLFFQWPKCFIFDRCVLFEAGFWDIHSVGCQCLWWDWSVPGLILNYHSKRKIWVSMHFFHALFFSLQ